VENLGSGKFGVVNKMQYQGEYYAVKKVRKETPAEDANILKEIDRGMRLDSKYVRKVFGYYEDDEHFFIVMEYLKGMDLCDFIRKNPVFFMKNPIFFWFVLVSILHGLAYLHSRMIAHFDLKPENVFLLLDDEENIIGVKLIDLGLSMEVNETTKEFRGTDHYMSPESFHLCLPTGLPADIWSFGMTAYAMLMASLPFSSKKKSKKCAQSKVYEKIESLLNSKKGVFNPFLEFSKDPSIRDMQSIILSCFAINPEKRPTAKQLLNYILSTDSSNAQINP